MRIVGIGFLGIGLLSVSLLQYERPLLVWNASISVPVGFYAVRHRRPDVGDLALVRLPPAIAEVAHRRHFLPRSALLLKPVAAIAGDRVCRFGADVFVQGRLVARAVLENEPLLAWRECRILKIGELFLLADHPASFDSRYFGPLHAKHVIGSALSVW
jgi:type IV secretory pathway protease TraF